MAPVSAGTARAGPPPAREVVLLADGAEERVVIADPGENRIRHVLGPSFAGLDAVAVAGQRVVWQHGQVEDALGVA